jgi:hypothetical protein
MAAEERRAQRFRIDQMIEMSFGREQSVRCRGVDLSEVGVLCRTDVPLEPGTRVYLLLSVGPGEDDVIRCEGAVARGRATDGGFEAGIAFGDLDAASRKKLRTYLSQRPRA